MVGGVVMGETCKGAGLRGCGYFGTVNLNEA